MLPKGWNLCQFGEVAEVGSGQVDPKAEPYASMIHIGPENIESGTGRIVSSKRCSELGLISGKYEFDEDAVVYSKIRPHLNKVCFPGFKGVCSADAYPIWPDKTKLLPEYLKQYMLGSTFEKRAVACSLRTGMPKINREDLDGIPVVLPPLVEQRRIDQILSTWDQAIATSERLLENSRTQWNALIGITLHLPSANPDASASADNGSFPASVQPGIPTLPPAPAGWRRIQLRDHLREVRRPVALKDDESYTLVTVKRSRGGVALREVLRGNEVKTPTQFHVRTGDFLVSKRQIVHGACGIVPPELDGAVVSNEYAALNTDGEIDLKFLRYLSETRYFQQTCFHSSIGVHVEKMIFKTDHWLNWPFNIPPLEQQRRIVEIMDTASREVASITEQLKALKREKSALMAQLLTGRRRVKLPDAETEVQE